MYFRGLAVEILQGGEQLREYCLQAKNTKTTTGQSYVVDEITNERKYSPITAYVVVKEAGKKFEIRYSAKMAREDNPIIAIIYVDGTNDYTYNGLLSPSPQEQNSFWDSSRNKKYYFTFYNAPYSTDVNLLSTRSRSLYGACGTISVYFYKGSKVSTRLTSIPYYNLNQSRMIEPKFRSEVNIITRFDEIADENISSKPIVDMIKQNNDPIAVLHVHYRSESWLTSIGMPIKRNYENSSTECTPLSLTATNNRSERAVNNQPVNDNIATGSHRNNQPVNDNIATGSHRNKQPVNDNIATDSHRNNQLVNDIDDLIQSLKNMNNNVTDKDGRDKNRPDENRCNGKSRDKNSHDNNRHTWRENVKQPKNKKRKKKQRNRSRKWRKRNDTQPIILKNQETMGKQAVTVKKENHAVTRKQLAETQATSKYKEYVEFEYHVSDYIEFGDGQDQILKKKTYRTEKTIIDLEDQ